MEPGCVLDLAYLVKKIDLKLLLDPCPAVHEALFRVEILLTLLGHAAVNGSGQIHLPAIKEDPNGVADFPHSRCCSR